ncbi:MAG: DUF2846 domain-containing protein [Bacteroidota bacterium]
MKKLFLFLIGILLFNFLSAQDIIIKKNGDEISAKIQEVGITEIKYKKVDNPDGPLFSILKTEVFMIKFENGTKEVMPTATVRNETISTTSTPAQSETPQKVTIIIYRKNSFSGVAVMYDLYANGKYITKVANNSYFATQLDEGLVTFTAKTEQTATQSMNLMPGTTYYLRCGVSTGMWMGIPSLEFVPENIGIIESSKIRH